MRLVVKTIVDSRPEEVRRGFDRHLFERLNPPFPPVTVRRFDGIYPHAEVHLELDFLFKRESWISIITEVSERPDGFTFVDEGRRLPFFLSTWKHTHRIEARGEGTCIIDDITYTCPFTLPGYFLYPFLWLQFVYRKPVYRSIFRRESR